MTDRVDIQYMKSIRQRTRKTSSAEKQFLVSNACALCVSVGRTFKVCRFDGGEDAPELGTSSRQLERAALRACHGGKEKVISLLHESELHTGEGLRCRDKGARRGRLSSSDKSRGAPPPFDPPSLSLAWLPRCAQCQTPGSVCFLHKAVLLGERQGMQE